MKHHELCTCRDCSGPSFWTATFSDPFCGAILGAIIGSVLGGVLMACGVHF